MYITEITCDMIIQATVWKKVYNTELTLPQKGIIALFCYWNSCVAGTMLCCIHTLPEAVNGREISHQVSRNKGNLLILSSTHTESSLTCLVCNSEMPDLLL